MREALILLGHEGLVESIPRTGYVVASFTGQDVLETFHLRTILEAEAAGLAAERITEDGRHATDVGFRSSFGDTPTAYGDY